MNYQYEKTLVTDFIRFLPSSLFAQRGPLKFTTEFDYSRGRTDIIALTNYNEIIAFEAKLLKWREALDQAYRNTCFANYSYIVLPKDVAFRALRYQHEFNARYVGICYLSSGKVEIAQEAPKTDPLQIWLYNKAKDCIEGDQGNVKCH